MWCLERKYKRFNQLNDLVKAKSSLERYLWLVILRFRSNYSFQKILVMKSKKKLLYKATSFDKRNQITKVQLVKIKGGCRSIIIGDIAVI